jgi:tetratricopeptide (TPR) repeat protein
LPGEHGSCLFSHALLRDRLYDSLVPTRRAELHWQAGLVNQGADATAAHHLLAGCLAGNTEIAATVARDAARTMLAQLAYEEAMVLAKRAHALIPAGSALGCELALVQAEALIRAGKGDEGRLIAKRAAALATELDAPKLFAGAALVYGTDVMTGGVDDTMVELLSAALEGLPPEPSTLRVRVMGRLATALSPPVEAAGAARIVSMSRAALAMARELGDKETLLYALTFGALGTSYMAPFAERAAMVGEAVLLARELGQRFALERSNGTHIVLLVEQGRRAEANVELHAFEEMMAEAGGMHRWALLGLHSVLALLDGRLGDAARLSDESRALARPGTPAEMSWALQRLAISQASGAAASIARDGDELLRFFSPRRGFMPWPSAWLFAALGKRAEAVAILESLLSVEQGFPALMSIGSSCALVKDSALAARAYVALAGEPSKNRVFWGPAACSVFGPRSRVLGDLALLLGRAEQASAHYDEAIELCRAMGAKPFLELSLRGREACGGCSKAPKPELKQPRLSLRREGDMWAIEAGGAPFRLKHSKGLAYLEQLVSQSGREVHVLMLVGAEHADGDPGAVLDARAKAEYQRRIEQLDDRIELARSLGDELGVAKARGELDAVAAELARAVGLGGRDRRASSNVERARINVQRRLKDSIESISVVDVALGRFLQATIKTGTFCSFQPL